MSDGTRAAAFEAAYVDAAATLLGLSIERHRDGVLRYFALAADMNAIVESFPLNVHDESGEVFEPVASVLPAMPSEGEWSQREPAT